MVFLLLLLLGFVPMQGMDNQALAPNAQGRQVPSLLKLSVANLEHVLGTATAEKQKELLAKLETFPEAVKQYILDYYVTNYKLQLPACQFSAPQSTPFNLLPDNTYITCISYTRDNQMLILGAKNGNVYLVDPLTKNIKAVLKGHTGAITSLCVSRKGEWLLTGSKDKTARCWDLDNLELYGVMDHAHKVKAVAFWYVDNVSTDIGCIITYDSKAACYFWTFMGFASMGVNSLMDRIRVHWIKPTTQIAFDNRGFNVVFGSCYVAKSNNMFVGVNIFRSINPDDMSFLCHEANQSSYRIYTAVAFSATGNCSVLANGISVTWVIDKNQYGTIPSANPFAKAKCVAVDSLGTCCAVGTAAHTIELYDLKDKKYRALLSGHQAPITTVSFSPDNKYLFSADTTGVVRVWDMLSSGQNLTVTQLWSLIKGFYKPKSGQSATVGVALEQALEAPSSLSCSVS